MLSSRTGMNIFFAPYVLFIVLNLVLKAIVQQVPSMRELCEIAKEIQAVTTNYQHRQDMYRHFVKLQLLKFTETIFASHYFMLQQLNEVKAALSSMMISKLGDNQTQKRLFI